MYPYSIDLHKQYILNLQLLFTFPPKTVPNMRHIGPPVCLGGDLERLKETIRLLENEVKNMKQDRRTKVSARQEWTK